MSRKFRSLINHFTSAPTCLRNYHILWSDLTNNLMGHRTHSERDGAGKNLHYNWGQVQFVQTSYSVSRSPRRTGSYTQKVIILFMCSSVWKKYPSKVSPLHFFIFIYFFPHFFRSNDNQTKEVCPLSLGARAVAIQPVGLLTKDVKVTFLCGAVHSAPAAQGMGAPGLLLLAAICIHWNLWGFKLVSRSEGECSGSGKGF